MSMPLNSDRRAVIKETLFAKHPAAAGALASEVIAKHPGSVVMLYGSGISVLENADASEVLYDFYVIAPSYRAVYSSKLMRVLNWAIPPNVYYIEKQTESGLLRAKYAVLSIDHFEKLVSKKTFHSYFWARFAQPSRIVAGPDDLKNRIASCIETAIDTFVARAKSVAGENANIREIWKAGLSKSYKAELRAETPERVDKLLDAYGDWPRLVTDIDVSQTSQGAVAWKVRSIQGGLLSVTRLLKGTMTFEGGVDYILWKISRHAGFSVPVKDWERKWPVFAAPFLLTRYLRMKRVHQS